MKLAAGTLYILMTPAAGTLYILMTLAAGTLYILNTSCNILYSYDTCCSYPLYLWHLLQVPSILMTLAAATLYIYDTCCRYPLYSRGKDKKLFLHATFLLNRNIENLRYSQDLHTKDPKLTLRNLKDLFETKFGVGLVLWIISPWLSLLCLWWAVILIKFTFFGWPQIVVISVHPRRKWMNPYPRPFLSEE